MKHWLSARWWIFAAGALAAGAMQISWLAAHHWTEAALRLGLIPPAGGVLFCLAAQGAFWLAARRGWDWEAASAGLGAFAWRVVTAPLAPFYSGRPLVTAFFALALAGAVCALGWSHWLAPKLGAAKVRALFLPLARDRVEGLSLFFSPSLDGSQAYRSLGVGSRFNFARTEHFPGNRRHHFRLLWLGVIDIPQSGLYGFGGWADDGLVILINGRPVAQSNREGARRFIQGWVRLSKGRQAISIHYLQWRGQAALELMWRPPGAKKWKSLKGASLHPLSRPPSLAKVLALRLRYGLVRPLSPLYNPLEGGRHWHLPW